MSEYLKANNLAEVDAGTNIIVHGYIRQSLSFLLSIIPSDIVSITLSYVHDHFMLHRGWYEWHINSQLLQTMMKANNEISFISNTFKISGLNWILEAYPNGNDSDSIGSFNLFLCILSMPSSWKSIIISYRFYCYETKSVFSELATYKCKYDDRGWPDDCLTLQDINNSNIQKLTFLVYVQILRINLKKNDEILYQYPLEYDATKIQKFEWNIDEIVMKEMKNARYKESFMSPLFHNMWCLNLYPNGRNNPGNLCLDLTLCALPMDKIKITVSWKVVCKQLDINTDLTKEFNQESNIWSWCGNPLSFDDFKKFDTFTFAVEISIDNKDEDENHEDDIDNLLTELKWEQYVEVVKKEKSSNLEDLMSQIKQLKHKNVIIANDLQAINDQLNCILRD